MNAREWDTIMLEVETEWQEILRTFEEAWIGERARLMEMENGERTERAAVLGTEEAELV